MSSFVTIGKVSFLNSQVVKGVPMNTLALGKFPNYCVNRCYGLHQCFKSANSFINRVCRSTSMTVGYSARQALDLVFDDEFGLSQDNTCEEDEEVFGC